MTTTEPTYLERWTRSANYYGDAWPEHYSSGCGRHRDSEALERANFRAMLNALGFDDSENVADDCPTDGDDEPTRVIVRENHWAVGWVEWIAIHESDTDGLAIADKIAEALEDYPVVDDDLFSDMEDCECATTWAECYDPSERLSYLREHIDNRKGVFRDVRKAVAGCWYSAGNLLPCPSDILH